MQQCLSSGEAFFLLLIPTVASCLEGFSGYVEFCGVLCNIPRETGHLEHFWAEGIGMGFF